MVAMWLFYRNIMWLILMYMGVANIQGFLSSFFPKYLSPSAAYTFLWDGHEANFYWSTIFMEC